MDASGQIAHRETTLATRRQRLLFAQQWIPLKASRTLVIVHGAGEHSGRYAATALRMAQAGWAVQAFDLEGHGRSPGTRGHVARFQHYVDDVADLVQEACSSGPPVLLGHSLGGLISTYYALEHPTAIRALVLSSPVWALALHVPWWKRAVAYSLAAVWPSLTLNRPHTDGVALSHDPEIASRYVNDPLVHPKTSVRLYVELQQRLRGLPEALPRLRVPLLIVQAADDLLVSAEAVQRLFPVVGSLQKRLIVYPGYYHEVLNEVGKDQVFADLLQWLLELDQPRPGDGFPQSDVLR